MTTLVAIPTYDGQIHASLTGALLNESRVPGTAFVVASKECSLLATGFNQLWCIALNNRDRFTHFLMIHADVVPRGAPGFIRRMQDEMRKTGAEALSGVLPIKDSKGLTSTALRFPDGRRRRLTMREAHKLPATFGAEEVARLFSWDGPCQLLINTGLLMVDLRAEWVERVWFAIEDSIALNEQGQFYPVVEPEDWRFSRVVGEQGGRLMATRTVAATHIGSIGFHNDSAWGEWAHDEVFIDRAETTAPRLVAVEELRV